MAAVFLVKRDRQFRRRSQQFASFEEARAAADKVIAQPERFKAVWIFDLATGAELFHQAIPLAEGT